MKIAATVARYLLGAIFAVFGLNGFVPFLPPPALQGLAVQFIGALRASHYMTAVFMVELVTGSLLLANLYVPFALTLLGPVIFNIILFHATMDRARLPLALFVLVLWILLALSRRSAFEGIFRRG